MGRRLSLPLTQGLFELGDTPTLAAMRKRLGGRVPGAALVTPDGIVAVGAVVGLASSSRADDARLGVLLAVTDEAVDVYVSEGIVKRTQRAFVQAHRGPVPDELARVAEAATIFGHLAEEDAVLVERAEGGLVSGKLVERCRYGALVELDGGTVLAVGFREIWPKNGDPALDN